MLTGKPSQTRQSASNGDAPSARIPQASTIRPVIIVVPLPLVWAMEQVISGAKKGLRSVYSALTNSMSVQPFTLAISDKDLDQVKRQAREALDAFPAFEANLADTPDDFRYGLPPKTARRLIERLATSYDWRAQEKAINEMGEHSLLKVQDAEEGEISIHFVHVRSPHADAKPLLLAHGWRGCFCFSVWQQAE
jgi:hypothetical protein